MFHRNRRPSLFWRTFLLLCGLIFFSAIGWLQSFRVFSELPYSQGEAQHIISTANLTKYALVNADPYYRVDLLKMLATRESSRLVNSLTAWCHFLAKGLIP